MIAWSRSRSRRPPQGVRSARGGNGREGRGCAVPGQCSGAMRVGLWQAGVRLNTATGVPPSCPVTVHDETKARSGAPGSGFRMRAGTVTFPAGTAAAPSSHQDPRSVRKRRRPAVAAIASPKENRNTAAAAQRPTQRWEKRPISVVGARNFTGVIDCGRFRKVHSDRQMLFLDYSPELFFVRNAGAARPLCIEWRPGHIAARSQNASSRPP